MVGLQLGLSAFMVPWNTLLLPIGLYIVLDLGIAVSIGLYGFGSGAALATVVGVLVEVPVMLSVVHIVMRTKGWYERG